MGSAIVTARGAGADNNNARITLYGDLVARDDVLGPERLQALVGQGVQHPDLRVADLRPQRRPMREATNHAKDLSRGAIELDLEVGLPRPVGAGAVIRRLGGRSNAT